MAVQVEAWCEQRNRTASAIHWTFTVDKAREKLARSYPQPLYDTAVPLAA